MNKNIVVGGEIFMQIKKTSAVVLSLLTVFAVLRVGGDNDVMAANNEQTIYSLADEQLSTGVRYTEEDVVNYLGNSGSRQRINQITIDPNDPNTRIIAKKAGDAVIDRENVLTQAQEEVGKGKNVIAGINADSFDINVAVGVSRTLNVCDGCVLESQPYDNYNKCDPTSDTYYKYQSILYIDTNGKLHVGPLNSNAYFTAGSLSADVTLLNRIDFSYAVQNDCYRAFTACATDDHILRYTNSSDKTTSSYKLPKTVRYAVIQIDPVDGKAFNGYVKAGQTYTGKVINKVSEDNFTINGTPSEIGTKDEFQIPENCIVIAGYSVLTPNDADYGTTKAAGIENLSVGQNVTYKCDLYKGFGFSTNNNSGSLTGVSDGDIATDVTDALGDFNTLALGGTVNNKNNNEIFKRSPQKTSRTMVGIESDGTVHLLTVASPSAAMADTSGTNYEEITTYMMQTLHCADVVSMDGGGSTTMVARRAGESSLSIVNYPSDGSPRLVGNSLLVVNTSGEAPKSTVAQIVLDKGVNLFAKSAYQFGVKLTDSNGNAISASGKNVYFSAVKGFIDQTGRYTAPTEACTDTVTATVDGVSSSTSVSVVDSVSSVRISPSKLTVNKGDQKQFSLTGYTADKQRVIIDPSLVSWTLSEPGFGTLQNGFLTVLSDTGNTKVTASFAGQDYSTDIYAGLAEQSIENFETTFPAAYHISGYMYGSCGGQRAGQSNSGANDTYIGYESKNSGSSLVKEGNYSLRITARASNWINRGKNGTINVFPDWDAASPDIGWSEDLRAALENSFTAKAMPKRFGMWVYSPDDNQDGISDNADCILYAYFLQDCPGSKVSGYDSHSSSIVLANSVDWIGWKWIEVNIPETWDMPVVFNWFCLVNTNKSASTDVKNEIVVDDLKFIYSTVRPNASEAGGVYSSPQTVTLTCSSEGAEIYYTTDGTEPTETNGKVYSSPVLISGNTTLKAKAFKSGLDSSLTMTEVYTVSAPARVSADYSKVDAALAKVPSDLSGYTDASVKVLNAAVAAVVRDLDVSRQAEVDAMASAIEAAVKNLAPIPAKVSADYSKVDAALAKVPADLSGYTDAGVKTLNAAVAAVVRDLDVSRQTEVDAMASAIETAVNGLVLAPVRISGDSGTIIEGAAGVVPSGTTISVRQITQGAQFDKIQQSLSGAEQFLLLDISLLSDGVKIEPSGKVTVTMPVPPGYDTNRLALYHIADDGTVENIPFTVEDGKIQFTTDRFSAYVIAETKQTQSSPKTGDQTKLPLVFGSAIASLASLFGIAALTARRRKKCRR